MSKSKLFTFLLIFLSFSAIFSFYNFESASAYTGTITYDAGTNTITCVGGSSGTPITFNDIYEADLSDTSWNVTEKQGNNQFMFNARINIGDSVTQTYFADTYKQIFFPTGILTADGDFLIKIMENSTFQVGILTSTGYKNGFAGCSIIAQQTNYYGYFIRPNSDSNTCVINLYGSSFSTLQNNNDMWIQGTRVYDCSFSYEAYLHYNIFTSGDINNIICTNTIAMMRRPKPDVSVNNFFGANQPAVGTGVWFQGSSGIVSNLEFTYTLTTYSHAVSLEDVKADCYLINCRFIERNGLDWQLSWSGTSTGRLFRQYTFNLNVLNGEITDFVKNATVQLWKDSVLVYEGITNSSGMIPTQTLTYGYYQQSTGNTIQNATSPYYLVITHPDWQTYVSRFYITEPLRLTVSMQEPTYTGYTEVEKSDYTTIILFVISLILCIIGLALTVPLLPLIALTVSVINVLLLTEISVFNILLIILNIIFTVITIVRTKTKNN